MGATAKARENLMRIRERNRLCVYVVERYSPKEGEIKIKDAFLDHTDATVAVTDVLNFMASQLREENPGKTFETYHDHLGDGMDYHGLEDVDGDEIAGYYITRTKLHERSN